MNERRIFIKWCRLTTTIAGIATTIVDCAKGVFGFSLFGGTASTIDAVGGVGNSLGISTTLTALESTTSSDIRFMTGIPYFLNVESIDDTTAGIPDNKDYSKVEENAQKIYDTFNKTHKVREGVNGIMIPTPELARKLDEILKSNNKETLYQALTALQETIEEVEKQDNKEISRQDSAEMELKLK